VEKQIQDIVRRGKSGQMDGYDLPAIRLYLGIKAKRTDKEGNPKPISHEELLRKLCANPRTGYRWQSGETVKGIPSDIQTAIVAILEEDPNVDDILRLRKERLMQDKKPWVFTEQKVRFAN
jgi:hypothetical protein